MSAEKRNRPTNVEQLSEENESLRRQLEKAQAEIEVLALHVDQSRQDEAAGLRYTTVFAGARKDDLNPHYPLGEQARKELQRRVDDANRLLTEAVREEPQTVRGIDPEPRGGDIPAAGGHQPGAGGRDRECERCVESVVRANTDGGAEISNGGFPEGGRPEAGERDGAVCQEAEGGDEASERGREDLVTQHRETQLGISRPTLG